jgi:hypothetical protein
MKSPVRPEGKTLISKAYSSPMGIGWSIHKNGGWRGQLARIHRWHERLHLAAVRGSQDLEDFAFTFFQNCYYLREWLQKTCSMSKSEIDTLFTSSKELELCRDICNGTKHLTIDRPSIDADFSIGREYDPNEKSGYRLLWIADGKYDVLELASRCVSILDQFTSRCVGPEN